MLRANEIPGDVPKDQKEVYFDKKTKQESLADEMFQELPFAEDSKELIDIARDYLSRVSLVQEESQDVETEELQKSKDRIEEIKITQDTRLNLVDERIENPFADLDKESYEELERVGVLASEDVGTCRELSKVLAEFEKKLEEQGSLTSEQNEYYSRLQDLTQKYDKYIESTLLEKQAEFEEKRQKVRNNVTEHYKKRLEELEEKIKNLEPENQVVEKTEDSNLKQEEFEEKIRQERAEIIKSTQAEVQSLKDRQEKALEVIERVTGSSDPERDFVDDLLELEKNDKNDYKEVVDNLRSVLIRSIKDGDKDAPSSPREIIPWKGNKHTYPYITTIKHLENDALVAEALKDAISEGDKHATQIQKMLERVINNNKVLYKLIGREWSKAKQGKKSQRGQLYVAFDLRQKREYEEASKKEAERREELDTKYRAREEEISAVANKEGGLRVTVPTFKPVFSAKEGRRILKEIGYKEGAVRLEKFKTPRKNTEMVRVVEVSGDLNDKDIRKGQVSTPDLRQFPHWLNEQYGFKSIPWSEEEVVSSSS